jgi:hypothetical protein
MFTAIELLHSHHSIKISVKTEEQNPANVHGHHISAITSSSSSSSSSPPPPPPPPPSSSS